jgi:hypothetical protein
VATERYVLLGLAHVRSAWFRDVARWATAATIPVDFVKAMSVEEVHVRLRSGRPFSALVVDAGMAGVDRDLVELARDVACPVIVVDDGRADRDWRELGATATVSADLGWRELLDALARAATPIARPDHVDPLVDDGTVVTGWRGSLIAVTGAGGSGASTVAIALAQGLAGDVHGRDMVLLGDFALHADQGMLHDAGDVVPGLMELVDAHRGGRLGVDQVRSVAFEVPDRGYHLLLGLRRHRDWTALRPRAFSAALDALRASYRFVVADIDPDVEGEAECGSLDVEERNLLARATAHDADLVLAVGTPGMKGLHGLLRVVRDLVASGVGAARILPVVNRAPRGPRARAEIAAVLADLLPGLVLASPLHLPDRRRLDDVLRDGTRLPPALADPLARSAREMLHRSHLPAAVGPSDGARVEPGSLGTWADQEGSLA